MVKEKDVKGLLVFAHGMGAGHLSYTTEINTLAKNGYKVLAYDNTGTCMSEGKNLNGFYQAVLDLKSCLEFIKTNNELNKLDKDIVGLVEIAPDIKDSADAELLLAYLDECVTISCKLIKIHPFGDGNGRAVRGFTNKMLEYVGLPPIYIKANERTEYHKAMNKANNDGDYTDIKNFYRYKVCDSIVELDINPRLRRQINGDSVLRTQAVKEKVDDLKRPKDAE